MDLHSCLLLLSAVLPYLWFTNTIVTGIVILHLFQLAPACAQRRCQKVNQANSSLSHSPVKVPVSVWTHCTNTWSNRCKTDLNSFPRRKLEETTGTSSYYMDENHSAGSEIQQPQYGRRSWLGSELSTLEIDVYVWRYALLVVLARNEWMNAYMHLLLDKLCQQLLYALLCTILCL